jgi:hypothetical protein
MSKKFKVVISVLVAVLLLTASGTAIAMAQDEPTPQTTREGLLARVADKLGVTQEQLVEAFQQARQEMREECQATGNCTVRQEKVNRFRECWTEKQQDWAQKRQEWMEKRQEWLEKKQEMGNCLQGKRTENQQNTRFRISEAVRGRQMIAVPRGWTGPMPSQQVD